MKVAAGAARLLAAGSLAWMGVQMLRVWRSPGDWDGGQAVEHCVTVMVAEFFLVHAGMMAFGLSLLRGRGMRFLALAVLLLFSVGAGGLLLYAREEGNSAFLQGYAFVLVTRYLSAFLAAERPEGPGDHDLQMWAAARSALHVALYLAAVASTVFVSYPTGAVTGGEPTGTGLWEQHPERVVGAATVYFFIQAGVELIWGWRPRRKRA
ncbi:MAG: hypothetical protein HZB55_14675 [Deltaproteobacteria bacterium]|nr:hypothetical protein [Deltaproteobacteria bacterium]